MKRTTLRRVCTHPLLDELHTDVNRREALSAVSNLTDALVDAVNSGVVEVFENQKRVEDEARELLTQATRFQKQTAQWVTSLHTFDQELREIGDFENWLKSMEHDLNNLGSALERIAKDGEQLR